MGETAHDLRSPLAGIREAIRLVYDGELGGVNDLQREMLGDAVGQCDAIRSLVDNMLHLDRLRSGLPSIRREWISPHQLRSTCRTVIESLAAVRRVGVVWDGFDGTVGRLYGDADLLRRLIINLAGNAIAVSGEGNRVMISLRAAETRGMARLMIVDHGPGMTAESIAEHARRGASGSGGSGLGLAIGVSLAALHFSRMVVRSEVGGGTRIGIQIPVAGPAAVADAFSRWRQRLVEATSGQPVSGVAASERIGMSVPLGSAVADAAKLAVRIDAAQPVVPGTVSREQELPFSGPLPRFPRQAVGVSLRADETAQPSECTAVSELLERNQKIHELVYQTDARRWIMLWDNNVDEATRRTADLDQKLRQQMGRAMWRWTPPATHSVAAASDRGNLRELLVRDTLHASSRAPVFDEDFRRDGEPTIDQQASQKTAERLDQELKRLQQLLRGQSSRLQQQASGLNRIMQ
jgi:lipoprotein-anchoring transpeptidase ErfK/SrfK